MLLNKEHPRKPTVRKNNVGDRGETVDEACLASELELVISGALDANTNHRDDDGAEDTQEG